MEEFLRTAMKNEQKNLEGSCQLTEELMKQALKKAIQDFFLL